METFSQNQMSVVEMKSTIKVLVGGIRSLVIAMTSCPHSSNDEEGSARCAPLPNHLTADEIQVLSEYLVSGLRLLDIFRIVLKDGVLYLKR